jgi:hypothetical protein
MCLLFMIIILSGEKRQHGGSLVGTQKRSCHGLSLIFENFGNLVESILTSGYVF